MKILTEEQRERIRKIQLEILQEVHNVCEQNNIHYCIGFGTVLGAVRHKGFIPWDDDADIMMLREEYEKFKKVANNKLGTKFFFQDHETDKEYLWGYGKVRNINTEYIRIGQEHIQSKTGVFIDIFPMDNVPESLLGKLVQDFTCFCYRKALWARVGKVNEKNILKKVVYKVLAVVDKEYIFNSLDKKIKKYNAKKTKRVRCLMYIAPGKQWNRTLNDINSRYGMKREWLKKRKQYKFENLLLWGPKDYDSYLTYIYGDYMTLPPEEKRVAHAPVSSIKLNDEGL